MMRSTLLAVLLMSSAAVPSAVAAAPSAQDQRLARISAPVSAARMKADIVKLVSFGTRHSLSSQTDPKRGIGASLRWSEGEFRKLGPGVETPSETMTGARVPTPVRITNVLGIQRGTTRPNDVIIISGHIDSRVTDVMNGAAAVANAISKADAAPTSTKLKWLAIAGGVLIVAAIAVFVLTHLH